MRILSLMIAILMVVPAVTATTWEDSPDDHELGRAVHREGDQAQVHWVPLTGTGQYANVDVLEASIEESEEALTFSVGLSGTEPSQQGPVSIGGVTPNYFSYQYLWQFDFHGESLYAGFTDWQRFDFTYFSIFTLVERDGWVWQNDRVFVMADDRDDMAGWSATVPKWWIRDADMVPIREGDRLEGLTFHAQDGDRFGSFGPCPDAQDPSDEPFTQGCRWYVRDLLQDGQDLGAFTVERSPPGVGHLFLRTEQPVRQSNGLATTYLFEARLHNLEDTADTVYLQVSSIPDGWEVHLPPLVDFDGEGQETVAIAVTVPFMHEHGASHFMELTAVSDRDPDVAMTNFFGVVFADPPQPAGHHDTLNFHADEDGNWGWMNTRIEDPQGTKEPVRSYNFDFFDTQYQAYWDFSLQPSLGIGLDFDLANPAKAVFDVELPVALEEATVTGDLYLYDWREDVRVPIGKGETVLPIEADTPTEVRLELQIDAAADRIPFDQGRNMILEINLTGEAVQLPTFFIGGDRGQAPMIHTEGASLELPLFDFHEEVDLSGLALSRLSLDARNGTYRGVNPGNTTVFAYNVTNKGDTQYTIDWELRGDDNFASWASFKPATTHVAPGGTSAVVLRVHAPLDAQDGQTAEYLLIGKVREEEDLQVFARATASVVTGFEIPDESDAASELEQEADEQNAANQKESPAVAVVVLAGSLMVLARRRK